MGSLERQRNIIDIRERRTPLRLQYRRDASRAWVTDLAWTESSGQAAGDPLRGVVHLGLDAGHLRFGVADAIGGEQDGPVPGELFCAALAACLDSTIRIVANHLGVAIQRLAILVTGDIDVRGTMGMDLEVPVGFQSLRVEIELALTAHGRETALHIIAMAERYSVILQTVRGSVPVEMVIAED